jgi:uncharacterized protein YecE (DUF72 family)
VTHDFRLLDCEEPLAAFLDEVAALGEKLGPLLVQLPPSLAYDASFAGAFFAVLRALHDGRCGPAECARTAGAVAIAITGEAGHLKCRGNQSSIITLIASRSFIAR